MLASELIKQLEDVIENDGDLPVVVAHGLHDDLTVISVESDEDEESLILEVGKDLT